MVTSQSYHYVMLPSAKCCVLIVLVLTTLSTALESELSEDNESPGKLFVVEGKISLSGAHIGPLTPQQRKTVYDDIVITLAGNHVHHTTLVRQDGKFVFDGVLQGPYLLEATSRYYAFEPLNVDVNKRHQGNVKVEKIVFNKRVPHIVMSPVAQISFF